MFERNRLFCFVAILLWGGLSAGCNHEIDVARQQNPAVDNFIEKKTATAVSDFKLSSPEQIRVADSKPVATKDGIVGQLSPGNRVDSNADDSSTQTNSVVSTLRIWRDRDSQYSTKAELLEISLDSQSVKLLKENGVAITVPIERLSEHDKNFLMHFLAAQKSGFGKTIPTLVEQAR